MISRTTWWLVIAATLINSFLAAGNVNRGLIEMPARQQTGPLAWAAFSRHADLATTAMILYPTEAFAGTLLSIAAAVSFRRDRVARPGASVLIYGAALMGISGLLATTQAAPVMLGVRDLGENAVALQQALNAFQFWGNVRGVFQVLAFVANLFSLVAISRPLTSHSAEA